MARLLSLLSLYFTHSLCMEMRETVERMVMVRTTGSDLQPAATGYIYKKENDGKPSVIEMGESEIMEHLSKLYDQPQAFAAPLPVAAGPFYAKEEDENKAASRNEERIIPVTENKEVDGIADEDFRKMFQEYGAKIDDPHKGFDDYLHGLANFKHGDHHSYEDDSDNDKKYKGYKINHHYGDEDADNYHSSKFERYVVTGGTKKGQDTKDAFGKHDGDEKRFEYDYKPYHEEHKINGFQNDKSDEKTDHGFYKDEPIGSNYHKYTTNSKYIGAINEDDERHDTQFGKEEEHGEESREHPAAVHSSESDSSEGQSVSEAKGRELKGKSYGFEIKH